MADPSYYILKFAIYKFLREHPGSSLSEVQAEFADSDVKSMLDQMVQQKIVNVNNMRYSSAVTTQTCYAPTESYDCGCQLISYIDHDGSGVVEFENMCSVDQYFTNGDISLNEYLFVLDAYLFYNGDAELRCPHGFAIAPVHPNHVSEYEITIQCYEKTEHFESVCHLLHAYDANHDGVITLRDVDTADRDYQNGDITPDEFFVVAYCYYTVNGNIRRICPDCAAVYDDIVVIEPQPDPDTDPDPEPEPEPEPEPDPDKDSTPMGDSTALLKFGIGVGLTGIVLAFLASRRK